MELQATTNIYLITEDIDQVLLKNIIITVKHEVIPYAFPISKILDFWISRKSRILKEPSLRFVGFWDF